jgi:hypothetical protein
MKNQVITLKFVHMKRIALSFITVMLVVCAYGQQPTAAATANNPVFKWESTTHDFGKIKLNVPVSYEFTFTNTGDVPLVISTVQASCGCTVTAYSKEPIEPNGSGYVKATFNAGTLGRFNKTVTVNANTETGITSLSITGEVVSGEVK